MSLVLFQTEEEFFIRSEDFVQKGVQTIVIDKSSLLISVQSDDSKLNQQTRTNQGPIYGIIGIINVSGHNFLATIKSVEQIGVINHADINKVTGVNLWAFDKNKADSSVTAILANVQKELCDGFYFAYGYDLTMSRQRRNAWMQNKEKSDLELIAADSRYFWNKAILKDFISHGVDPRWFTPLVNGFIGYTDGKIGQINVKICLIARRMHHRAGTRYNSRGINDEGFVSNQIEKEQILIVDEKQFYSHVQLSGTVPVFWEQKTLKEAVKIMRTPELTKVAFHKHFQDMVETYGPITIINLLRFKKPKEATLTKEFMRHVNESPLKQDITAVNFDFHGYCHGDKYQALKVLIEKVQQDVVDQHWFTENLLSRKVETSQHGAFRTNCLDSLDRTNVVQSKMGMVVLQIQLKLLGIDLQGIYGPEVESQGIAFMYEHNQNTVTQKFREMWTEMGDYLSRQYVGTDSTISRVTRDGKEGFFGKKDHQIKVMQRWLFNTYQTNPQHTSVDVILGKHISTNYSSKPRKIVTHKLDKLKDQFSTQDLIRMTVATWNVDEQQPQDVDLSPWLFPFANSLETPEILVIGFQNTLKQPAGMFSKQKVDAVFWTNQIAKCLLKQDSQAQYQLIANEHQIDSQMCVFAKKFDQTRIGDILCCSVKTANGKAGNVIRFNFDDTSFFLINCCLPEGNASVERTQALDEIISKAFKKERSHQYAQYDYHNHDVKVVLGSLNFGLNLENKRVEQLAESHDYGELYKSDEKFLSNNQLLQNFQEGQLTFLPTSYYQLGSGEYKKTQKICWADRVLFSRQDEQDTQMTLIHYGRAELFETEHRPVMAMFEAKVRKIDHEARGKIKKAINKKIAGQSFTEQSPLQVESKSPLIKQNNQMGTISEQMISNHSESLEFDELIKLTEYEYESDNDDSRESPTTPITPITTSSVVPLHIKKQVSLEKSICDLKDVELQKLITQANIEKTQEQMREAERLYRVIDIPLDYFAQKNFGTSPQQQTPQIAVENPEECKTSESPDQMLSVRLISETPTLAARQADEDDVIALNDDDF